MLHSWLSDGEANPQEVAKWYQVGTQVMVMHRSSIISHTVTIVYMHSTLHPHTLKPSAPMATYFLGMEKFFPSKPSGGQED